MNTKTMRFLALSVSALVILPLGAAGITPYSEGDKRYTSSAENVSEETTVLNLIEPTTNKRDFAIYIPPAPIRPIPRIRTTILATRAPDNGYPVVTLLVPEHVALTAQKKPTLFWHLSEATENTVVVTLVDPDSAKPLLEEQFESPVFPGIHSLKLADYDVHLQLNKLYEWSVRIVEDPNDPSGDAVAKSFIEQVKPNAEIRAVAEKNNPLIRAAAFARNGIWYDALVEVSEKAASARAQNGLRRARDSLLEQIALSEVVNSIRASDIELGSNL